MATSIHADSEDAEREFHDAVGHLSDHGVELGHVEQAAESAAGIWFLHGTREWDEQADHVAYLLEDNMVNHSTSPTDFRDRRFLRDRVKELIGDAFEWYMRTSSAPDADGSRRETETRMCTAGVVMGKESAATWRQIEAYCLAINGGQRLLGDIGKLFSDEDKSAQLPDRTISTFECQDFAVRFMKLFPRQPNHRVFCQGLVWHVLVSMLDNVITERIGARVINEVVHDTSDPEISTMLRGQTAFLYRRGWLCDLAGTSYFATRINP